MKRWTCFNAAPEGVKGFGIKLVNALFLLLGFASPAWAQGGPPLLTDDPDTPGDRHWEVNVGATTEANSKVRAGDLVHVDLNYGLGDRIQLKYETGETYFRGGGTNVSGMGDSLFGVKYRFFETGTETEGLRVSVYPQVETRGPFGAKSDDLTTPHTMYYLPVEVKYGFGAVALDGDLGREIAAKDGAGWFWGVACGYTPIEHVELIAEARKQTGEQFPMQGRMVQVGARLELNEAFAFMFAAGRLESDAPLGWSDVGYLGVRLTF